MEVILYLVLLHLLVEVMAHLTMLVVDFPEHLVVLVVALLVVHLLLEALVIPHLHHQAKAITAALVRLALQITGQVVAVALVELVLLERQQ
jgi:hypothetical protein